MTGLATFADMTAVTAPRSPSNKRIADSALEKQTQLGTHAAPRS